MTAPCRREDTRHCFVLEGKMALPNQYFAARIGSRFLIALRDSKKILGLRCATCGKTLVPPREYCEMCGEKISDQWVELKSAGTLVNFTVVRYHDRHLPRDHVGLRLRRAAIGHGRQVEAMAVLEVLDDQVVDAA